MTCTGDLIRSYENNFNLETAKKNYRENMLTNNYPSDFKQKIPKQANLKTEVVNFLKPEDNVSSKKCFSQRLHFKNNSKEEKITERKHFDYRPLKQNDMYHVYIKEVNRFHLDKSHGNKFEQAVEKRQTMKDIINPPEKFVVNEYLIHGNKTTDPTRKEYSKVLKQRELKGSVQFG